MLALEMRFLTGRYAATHYNDRRRAEWPPHPARVYSALVAALYDEPSPPADERVALEWLAAAGAPDIVEPGASFRRQSEVYVPPNDGKALDGIDAYIEKLAEAERAAENATGKAQAKAQKTADKARAALLKRSLATAAASGKGAPAGAAELLPDGRKRQPRTFPVALPRAEVVQLQWHVDPPEGAAEALDRVAAKVARLGNSSSLVSMRVTTRGDALESHTRWIPDAYGDEMLRVPTARQLERLVEAHGRHAQTEPRVLPAGFVAYSNRARCLPKAGVPGSVFARSGWLVFAVVPPPEGGRRCLLGTSMAQAVARALRGTLQAAVDASWPEVLSGHAPGGGPSQAPHLAIVPLVDVGHRYASGTILGVALVPPEGLDSDARIALLQAVAHAEEEAAGWDPEGEPPTLRLTLGRSGVMHLRRLRDIPLTKALQADRWIRPCKRWSTVTAIALDKNPGNMRSRDPEVAARADAEAEEIVAAACVNVGLPQPIAVWIHRRAVLDGPPEANRFMPFPSEGNGPRRVCVHAELLFAEPVSGPLLLGAGRYLGLGLCAPKES